ncbi:putative transcription factor C2C2-GATA family [Helianthus debilis subsp. tardiflorus]
MLHVCWEFSFQNVGTYEPKFQLKETLISGVKPQQPTFSQDKSLYGVPKSFEAPSPDSVLERRTLSSACKTILFGTETTIPVRTRTKRSWSGLITNPWSKSLLLIPLQNKKKKRRNFLQHDVNKTKKCTHCEITNTPQWREGPMGLKTLCNACGVRYRSGRLFPEYRPAASPTFVPSLHSNSHRKVVEMRQNGAAMDETYIVKKPLGSSIQTQKHTRLCS